MKKYTLKFETESGITITLESDNIDNVKAMADTIKESFVLKI